MKLRSVLIVFSLFIASLLFPPRAQAVASDNWKWVKHVDGIVGAGQIASVVVDPTDQSIIYALTTTAGVYKTTDTGANWSAVNTGLPSTKLVSWSHLVDRSLTIDPNNHLVLYVQLNGSIYKTTDGGSNWASAMTGISTSCGRFSIAGTIIDPTNSNNVFAAAITNACSGGIWKSTDAASNWTQIAGSTASGGTVGGEGYNDAFPIGIDPSDTQKMYFTTVHQENFRSVDGGTSWTSMSFPSPHNLDEGVALTVHPTNHHIFIGTTNGFLVSTDYGVTWTANSTLNNKWISAVDFAPSDPTIGYAVSTAGDIYTTTNSGDTWSLVSSNSSLIFYSLTISPTDSTRLYLGTHGNGVYKSTNGGATISTINTGLPVTITTGFWGYNSSTSSPSIVYYSVANSGFYKSTDHGYTWTRVNSSTIPSIVRVDPTDPNIILGGSGGGIVRSTDGGVNWTSVQASFNVLDIVFAPSNHNIVLAHGNACADCVIKSIDNGQTWSSVAFFAGKTFYRPGIDIDPTDPNTMYAAPFNTGGPWKSIDGGDNWSAVNTGIADTAGYSIAVSPWDHNTLFWGSWNGNLYFRSTNGGSTWTQVLDLSSYNDSNAAHVRFDASDTTIVYAGADAGKMNYISTDGGTTWSVQPNTGLPIGADNYYQPSKKNTLEIFSTDSSLDFYIYENDIPKFDQSTFTAVNHNGSTAIYHPGDTVDFTFTLNNTGPAKATNPQVQITLPSGITYVAGSTVVDGTAITDPISGRVLTISTANLYYNESQAITFQATIDGGTVGKTIAVTSPTVTSDEDTAGTSISGLSFLVTGTFGALSSSAAPSCGDLKPSSRPNLFQIDTTNTKATLFFTPAGSPYTNYFISYGKSANAQQYGVQFDRSNWNGVNSFDINLLSPNMVYYFKVRGGNGCATGDWSNIMKVSTARYPGSILKYYLYGRSVGYGYSAFPTANYIPATSSPEPTAPAPQPEPDIFIVPPPPEPTKTCILWDLICW